MNFVTVCISVFLKVLTNGQFIFQFLSAPRITRVMEDFANSEAEHDLDLPTLPLFNQLNVKTGHSEEWRETSRWVKFQEDVEDEGKRWSKPFVPSVPLSAILDVRQCFLNGVVAFDLKNSYTIVDILGKNLGFLLGWGTY